MLGNGFISVDTNVDKVLAPDDASSAGNATEQASNKEGDSQYKTSHDPQ